jgi:hypothetical protein
MKYRVWQHDASAVGLQVTCEREVEADSPHQAAEQYADDEYNNHGRIAESYELVMTDDEGIEYKSTVDVNTIVTFSAFVTRSKAAT